MSEKLESDLPGEAIPAPTKLDCMIDTMRPESSVTEMAIVSGIQCRVNAGPSSQQGMAPYLELEAPHFEFGFALAAVVASSYAASLQQSSLNAPQDHFSE